MFIASLAVPLWLSYTHNQQNVHYQIHPEAMKLDAAAATVVINGDFEDFLKQEFSAENLYFVEEAQDFKRQCEQQNNEQPVTTLTT